MGLIHPSECIDGNNAVKSVGSLGPGGIVLAFVATTGQGSSNISNVFV